MVCDSQVIGKPECQRPLPDKKTDFINRVGNEDMSKNTEKC